jgi:hypothetical protein
MPHRLEYLIDKLFTFEEDAALARVCDGVGKRSEAPQMPCHRGPCTGRGVEGTRV